ncbi:MAG: 23S rRNA (uracil(1939)-C(5))-methyltransferase RlmD [Bacilli bacterium]|nr:23S rRNA (uracil(1939)-C(5))-methyltransferase RlmD [Bacilli bacterium]MBO5414153.1 23S rRNA (uracil(1939)-C(5))-methyltransferase RlmD [Bacilli bacterium]
MKVERLDHYGRGIIKIDGKIGFIENALENEDIEIDIIKENKKYFEGKSKLINNKNKARINPICPYYDNCGGCHLMHMNDELQKEFKTEKIKNIINKFLDNEVKVNDVVKLNDLNYRNKVVLHVENNKLGFYKDKSNDLIDIDKCLLLNDKLNEIINILKDYIKEETNINKITIKLGNITNEVMLIVEGNVKKYYKLLEISDVLVINNEIVTDKKYINSYIGNKKYVVSKNSFFQVNYDIATSIYDKVRNYIDKLNSKNVLDLYCGAGTIGIYIADLVDNVLGIEVVSDAIGDAEINKKINNVENIDFILGKVENLVDKINDRFDTVIVDPPRSGLDKKVIETLLKVKPKNIIYVSCDPITLARDLKLLENNYSIIEVTPYDMFCNTYHVETITLLSL